MMMRQWYVKDPDLVGRVARIVRMRVNRRVKTLFRDEGADSFVLGFDAGAHWAIEQMRETFREQAKNDTFKPKQWYPVAAPLEPNELLRGVSQARR